MLDITEKHNPEHLTSMSIHTAAVLETLGQELKPKSQAIPEAVHGSAIVKVLAT